MAITELYKIPRDDICPDNFNLFWLSPFVLESLRWNRRQMLSFAQQLLLLSSTQESRCVEFYHNFLFVGHLMLTSWRIQLKFAIPRRQTHEWCRISCRPGSVNYVNYVFPSSFFHHHSKQANVIPSSARVTVNHRVHPSNTIEEVRRLLRLLVYSLFVVLCFVSFYLPILF